MKKKLKGDFSKKNLLKWLNSLQNVNIEQQKSAALIVIGIALLDIRDLLTDKKEQS